MHTLPLQRKDRRWMKTLVATGVTSSCGKKMSEKQVWRLRDLVQKHHLICTLELGEFEALLYVYDPQKLPLKSTEKERRRAFVVGISPSHQFLIEKIGQFVEKEFTHNKENDKLLKKYGFLRPKRYGYYAA